MTKSFDMIDFQKFLYKLEMFLTLNYGFYIDTYVLARSFCSETIVTTVGVEVNNNF